MLLELGMKADLASDKVEEELSALSECPSVSTSFLCSHICTIQEFHTIKNHVIWCSGLSDPAHGCLKSRVHAAADIAYVPSLATVKLNCYGHHDHSEPSLTVANDGTHTLGHLKNTPIWGVSRPPLGMLSLKAGTLFRCS